MAIINALTDTWNNVATTFTAIKMTVTDTTSAAGSKLIDLLVSASSRFSVDKDGVTAFGAATANKAFLLVNGEGGASHVAGYYGGIVVGNNTVLSTRTYVGSDKVGVASNAAFGFAGGTSGGGSLDTAAYRGTAGRWDFCTTNSSTYGQVKTKDFISSAGLHATDAAAPTIASAGTIAPVTQFAFVSGTTTISTITAPSPISSGGGQITLIPTGLWVTNTAGNIALATTAVVSKALTMTYDVTTAKWYPSY